MLRRAFLRLLTMWPLARFTARWTSTATVETIAELPAKHFTPGSTFTLYGRE